MSIFKLEKIEMLSFTMDYENKEIVLRCEVAKDEYKQLRLCERDVLSMESWFALKEENK